MTGGIPIFWTIIDLVVFATGSFASQQERCR